MSFDKNLAATDNFEQSSGNEQSPRAAQLLNPLQIIQHRFRDQVGVRSVVISLSMSAMVKTGREVGPLWERSVASSESEPL
jgi:hypothetical protein